MNEIIKIVLYLFNSFPLLFIIIFLYLFKYITLTQIILIYLLYCIYWQLFSKVTLIFTKNKLNQELLNNCPSILNPRYKPHFFLPICIFQMLICEFWKPLGREKLVYEIQNVNKYGTKILWAKFSDMTRKFTNEPILFLFPGMTGVVENGYIQNLVIEGLHQGYNVVVYQMRILSEDFRLNETGTFKIYDDIDESLNCIIQKYKNSKIFAISGSYGSNNLVYYLGNLNNINKKIEAAVSICNPYDMYLCERFLEGTIFSWIITYLERRNFKKLRKGIENCKINNINIEYLSNCDDMKSYDEEFSSKVYGYKSADDYYRKISALRNFENINIPLLCINSKDDGLIPCRVIPYDDIRLNKNIFLLLADKGAHMCFFSNEKLFGLKQWHLKPIFEFLSSCQNTIKKNV